MLPYFFITLLNGQYICFQVYEDAFISVVYSNMEKVLLYWCMYQYNNVQKLVEVVDMKEGCYCCQDGRKGLILCQ